MSLKSEMLTLLENAQRLCEGCEDGKNFREQLMQMRDRLNRPLRVAVVGIMKAGKSTFLNALMGADLVYTGEVETTYTVCWFRYGSKPSLTVCFRDGEELHTSFDELKRWSVRAYETENPRIHDVKYLMIYYPSEVLKVMEFIDTPGLNSVYQTDAQNTLDFLSLRGSEETLQEAGMADAVIYGFSKTASGFDEKLLDSFHGNAGNASPINSIGILTKADVTGIWQITDKETPVEKAKSVSDTVMKNPSMKHLLFSTIPVCAKPCEGYSELKECDWETLQKLAQAEDEDVQDLLFDARNFKYSDEEDFNVFAGQTERQRILDSLGQYGILEITRQLREGKTKEEIGPILQEKCGIQKIRDLLLNHFGNRMFLIKTQFIFDHLHKLIYQIRSSTDSKSRIRNIADQISKEMEQLNTSVQTLNELKALQMYYNGQLQFSDESEKEDFLRIMGEYGRAPEQRLGAEAGTTVYELKQLAREKIDLWHGKAAIGMMVSPDYAEGAYILARSYETMYYHLSALCEE